MLIAQRYEIGKTLGSGGMGTVFQGKDTQTNKPVAIKLLKPEIVSQLDMVERFSREAAALRQLNHPNIVGVITTLQEEGKHYIIMEYVSGGSLRDIITKHKTLPVDRALKIMLDLADALTRAHRLDIIHRDIKPDNVLLAEDDTPRLTDFGVAHIGRAERMTQTGVAVGTLDYMAPEVLDGSNVDNRADIWSFGVMLYELLVGERPFKGETLSQVITAILTQPTPDLEALRPDIPTSLVDLIYRMIQKDRHARIPSIRLVGAELEAIIQNTDNSTMQRVIVPSTGGRFQSTAEVRAVSTSQIIPTNNIPAQPTAFVGREKELHELKKLIEGSTTRHITLLGPGGIGKSRIAIEVAEGNIHNFQDGVYFIPLAPIEDPELLISSIAEHIGFTFSGAEDPKTQLVNYFAEKHMLLILDNFEHILSGANIITDILSAAPNMQIIVTSRERLRLRSEQLFEVHGMLIPDEDVPDDQICNYPIVKLFEQSASRVRPDFEVNEETAPHVVKIAHLVQGLPLGIELAAAWVEMLDITEIAGEIANSLDFLETDLQDVPERHRSLRAVFEYSWNLMTAAERDVFIQLSIFRGGFEREAAQKIAKADLRTLTGLVNKSLLQRDPSGRYQVPKMLRQYAEEHLQDHDQRDEIHAAHAAYYCEFIQRLDPTFNRIKEHQAFDIFESELENIRIAWNWIIQKQQWQHVEPIADSLVWFHLGRSMLREGTEMFNKLAERLIETGQGNSRLYWVARVSQIMIEYGMGDHEKILNYARGAVDFFRQKPDKKYMIYSLNMMSYPLMMLGEYDASIDSAREAIAIDPQKEFLTMWFMSIGNQAYAEYLRGNYAEARRLQEEVIKQAEPAKYSPIGTAYAINNLGETIRAQGDLKTARTYFEQAFELFKKYKMRRGMAFTLNNIAGSDFADGQFDEAKRNYQRGYNLHKDIGDRVGIGHSLSALGITAFSAEDLKTAKKYYEQSLEIRRTMSDQKAIGESLIDLARVAIALNNFDVANAYLDEALTIHKKLGDNSQIALTLIVKALIHLEHKDLNKASQLMDEAEEHNPMTGFDFTFYQFLSIRIEIALRENRLDDAVKILKTILTTAISMGNLPAVIVVTIINAAIVDVQRNPDNAQQAMEILFMPANKSGAYKIFMPYITNRLNDFKIDLEQRLSPAQIEAAWERAQSLTLEEAARIFHDKL